ncbi:MAG: redoxin domain-containing protein [Candidatus Latescibacteria bacterium]|nr:redoxin domain-containing protein [Candidatus Latescibacterota bacterium]
MTNQLLILCLLLPALTATAQDAPPSYNPPGAAIKLAVAGGDSLQLGQFEGRVVLLNFWATWCRPCMVELPELVQLQKTYADSGLTIVAVSTDKFPRKVEAFLEKTPLDPLTVLLDYDSQLVAQYDPTGYPASYFLDRQGKLRYHHIGFSPEDLTRYEAEIRALLRQSAPAEASP